MKKIISLLLCVMLLVSIAGCGCGKSEAEEGKGENTISVSGAKGSKGDEVIVYVTASDKTPVAAYQMYLSFDEAKLELVEYGLSEKFEKEYHGINLSSDETGKITFAGANATEAEEMYQGEMFFARFSIIGEEKGEVELPLDIEILTSFDEVAHEDEFTAVNGKITIE